MARTASSRCRRRVRGEHPRDPRPVHLGQVDLEVPAETTTGIDVEVIELPEALLEIERHRPGPPRPPVLGPHPDPADPGVLGEEPLQRRLVGRSDVVRDRAERLELAPALQLDDPLLVAAHQGRVEREEGVEVAHRELRRDDEVRQVEVAEHPLIGLRVGVHVPDIPDPDRPGPEVDRRVMLGRDLALPSAASSAPPRRPGPRGPVVVPAGHVVDRAASPMRIIRPLAHGKVVKNSSIPARYTPQSGVGRVDPPSSRCR